MAVPATQLAVWQPWARFVEHVSWPYVSSCLLVGAVASSFFMDGPLATWALVGYVVGITGVLVTGGVASRPNLWLAGGLLYIALSMLASLLWGAEVIVTLTQAVWLLCLIPVTFVKRAVLLRAIPWLLPMVLLHAASVAVQGWSLEITRANGMIGNPNPAAALLALGIIGVLFSRVRRLEWLAVPMLYALAFTGSRWATAILLVVLGLLFLKGHPVQRWKIPALVLAAGVLLLPWHDHVTAGYRLTSFLDTNPTTVSVEERVTQLEKEIRKDFARRTELPSAPAVAAQGVVDRDGNHNVYLRIAHDAGIPAGIAFTALALYGLWRGRGAAWWMLLVLVLCGLLDYYMIQLGRLSVVYFALLTLTIGTERSHAVD